MEGMSLLKYQKPKGTADILADESAKWQYVEGKARELFKKYRYHEMRTPTFENFRSLFTDFRGNIRYRNEGNVRFPR